MKLYNKELNFLLFIVVVVNRSWTVFCLVFRPGSIIRLVRQLKMEKMTRGLDNALA